MAECSTRRDSEEKQPSAHHEGHSLEAFRERLRDLCGHHLEGAGDDRARLAKDQAEQACALGRELGLLITPEVSWEQLKVIG